MFCVFIFISGVLVGVIGYQIERYIMDEIDYNGYKKFCDKLDVSDIDSDKKK